MMLSFTKLRALTLNDQAVFPLHSIVLPQRCSHPVPIHLLLSIQPENRFTVPQVGPLGQVMPASGIFNRRLHGVFVLHYITRRENINPNGTLRLPRASCQVAVLGSCNAATTMRRRMAPNIN